MLKVLHLLSVLLGADLGFRLLPPVCSALLLSLGSAWAESGGALMLLLLPLLHFHKLATRSHYTGMQEGNYWYHAPAAVVPIVHTRSRPVLADLHCAALLRMMRMSRSWIQAQDTTLQKKISNSNHRCLLRVPRWRTAGSKRAL
jgi:hypothetical protein